jgi:predicted acylesterase/phospholipase RssA
LILSGCAHYPINAKLDAHNEDVGYRFKNLNSSDNTDSLFVILTFSGGGTRAAALSYGVLETLRDIEIEWEGQTRRLLDEVDVISSVSGGSFTAAYFALNGDGIFKDFESRFLKKNIQGELTQRLFYPANWFRLASPTYNRIDMAAEYYSEHVFGHCTYNNLIKQRRRPYILINATDMGIGSRFEFTQDQFDPICSNLAQFEIARAVAASSAFPVLLSPVTIKNFAGTCKFKEPDWVVNGMEDKYVAPRRFNSALTLRSYQNRTNRPYIHLIDGGVADNIGLRGPYHALATTDSPWSVLRMKNLKQVEKILVIVVNSKTDPDSTIDQKESAPGWQQVLMSVATDPMDNYSFETIELLTESFKQWKKDYETDEFFKQTIKAIDPDHELLKDTKFKVDYYAAVIGFDMLEDEEEQHYFKNLPTTFKLPPETIDRLREVASKLLCESKKFNDFLRDFDASCE